MLGYFNASDRGMSPELQLGVEKTQRQGRPRLFDSIMTERTRKRFQESPSEPDSVEDLTGPWNWRSESDVVERHGVDRDHDPARCAASS